VTEFDWSWTGQFGRAGWYLPLQVRLAPGVIGGLQNNGAFSVDGNQYAVCYSNDFRISANTTKMFADAGITEAPTTFDELTADLQKIKDAGVAENPLTMPLSATEGTATLWYLLTLAYGGQLFDENFQPAFTSPDSGGYKALQFMVDAVDKGFVTPGAVSLTDTQSDNRYTSGSAAVTLSGGPDEMVVANDPSQSKIAGDAAFMLVPGETGPGATFGLPEGLGVMSTSEHPEASIAFLNWWEQQDTLLALQKSTGLLPCSTDAVQTLVDQGKLVGGDAINQELQHVAPLFPQGAPPWYTDFSTKAAALINAAASGDLSVQDALNQLATEAQTLQSSLGWRRPPPARRGRCSARRWESAVPRDRGARVRPAAAWLAPEHAEVLLRHPGGFVGLQNYASVLRDPSTLTATVHTAGYMFVAVLIELVLGVCFALALNEPFRGRGLVMAALILPWALPSVVSNILWLHLQSRHRPVEHHLVARARADGTKGVVRERGWAIAFIALVHSWGWSPDHVDHHGGTARDRGPDLRRGRRGRRKRVAAVPIPDSAAVASAFAVALMAALKSSSMSTNQGRGNQPLHHRAPASLGLGNPHRADLRARPSPTR
jgi:multiple sugar transport system substrate-binding protein